MTVCNIVGFMSNTPLKDWRVSAKLKQKPAAKKLGISQSAVSLYERNLGQPSPALATEISRITGIPREQLRPDIYGEARS